MDLKIIYSGLFRCKGFFFSHVQTLLVLGGAATPQAAPMSWASNARDPSFVKVLSMSRKVQIQDSDFSHTLPRWARCPEFFGVSWNTIGWSCDMGVTGIEIAREAVSKKE